MALQVMAGHAHAPTPSRKSEGVRLVCFLNASFNVDFDAKPESLTL
jgi:hypothetical protein